jgi:hypothetical protein
MVDYPYDALAAASVRIKDITSCAQNRKLLHRIKNNDTAVTSLYIEEVEGDDYFGNFYARDGNELGWLGYFVGENETLKSLSVCHLPACSNEVEIFFTGLQRNKSIKEIEFLGEGFLGESTLSVINLPHVTTIRMECDLEHEQARHFAVGLHRCKSLAKYFGPVTEKIVKSLAALPKLETVCVWRNGDTAISREECVALMGLLSNATNMKQLDLCCTALGNEGLAILAEGLACNASLIDGVLDLSDNGIGDEGVQGLASSLASNTKLRELRLANNNIGDAGLEALADSLAQNRALRVLSIARNAAITAAGMRSVSQILQSSGLEDLRLDGINFRNEGWNTLAGALSINKSLVSLSLQCEWWDGVSIGDDVLRALARGLSHNSHLKTLDLSGNTAITASGLRSLEKYFRSPSCALKELNLFGINIGDMGAHALADVLAGNKSLSSLSFSEMGITWKGWRSFLKLICDLSSPNMLYLSNQTLRSLSGCSNPSGSDIRNSIASWLKINIDCQTPNLAAKTKILQLFPDIDMVPLFRWNLKLLPLLKCWFNVIGESNEFEASIRKNELSCIYKFVRGFPVLVADDLRRYLNGQVERIHAMMNELEEAKRRLMQG